MFVECGQEFVVVEKRRAEVALTIKGTRRNIRKVVVVLAPLAGDPHSVTWRTILIVLGVPDTNRDVWFDFGDIIPVIDEGIGGIVVQYPLVGINDRAVHFDP